MTITDTRYEGLLDAIQGFDTTSSPPCEVFKAHGEERCGKPSYKRIHCRCSCGVAEFVFICRPCDEDGTYCCYCGSYDFTASPA